MSGIAVLFQRDGQPVEAAGLAAMLDAIDFHARDGSDIRRDGPIGFGFARTNVTTEDAHEHQPIVSPDTGCVIVADARLDNRAELLHLLQLERPDTVGDGEVILRTYERWGLDALPLLLGDFAFAIWDARQHRLVCARDTSGQRSLFYRLTDRQFAAGTEIHQLFQDPAVPLVPNEDRIRDYLIPHFVYRNNQDRQVTFFADVNSLMAGHVLVVDEQSCTIRQYWDIGVPRDIRYRHRNEYLQHFVDIYTEALRARLRSAYPVASTLSGGLDSSSIVCLAMCLLEPEKLSKFFAITLTFPGEICDESGWVADIARNYEPLRIHWLDGHGVVSDLADEPEGFCPEPARRSDQLDVMRAAAEEGGARTLLTGLWADNCLSPPPFGFDSLLRRGRLHDLWRHLSTHRQLTNDSRFKMIAIDTLAPLLPMPILRRVASWHALQEIDRTRETIIPSWITAGWRRSLLSAHRDAEEQAQRSRRFASPEREERFRELYPAETHYRYFATGVQDVQPFADRRMHEFVLGLPFELLYDPVPWLQSVYLGRKVVLRQSLYRIIPDSVRLRGNKTYFNNLLVADLRERWTTYERAFGPRGRALTVQRGIIDRAPFFDRLEDLRRGRFLPDGIYVSRVLWLENWLRSFELTSRTRRKLPPSPRPRPAPDREALQRLVGRGDGSSSGSSLSVTSAVYTG